MSCKLLENYYVISRLIKRDPNGCNAAPFTKVIRYFSGGDQSGTIAVLCETPNCEYQVSVKEMRQHNLSNRNEAASVEAAVAQRGTELVLKGYTPNIAILYGVRKCKIPRTMYPGLNPGELRLFYEVCSGSLDKWHEGKRRSEREWFAMLFQSIHGLMALHNIGIMHGDLHDGNILFCPVPKDLHIGYRVGGQKFSVPTHGNLFKIYDFGNAFAQQELGQHAHYRIGASTKSKVSHHRTFRPDYDLVKLFHWMYLEKYDRNNIPEIVRDFMYDVLTDDGKLKWAVKAVDKELGHSGSKSFSWDFLDKKPGASGIINSTSANLEELLLWIGRRYFACGQHKQCEPQHFDMQQPVDWETLCGMRRNKKKVEGKSWGNPYEMKRVSPVRNKRKPQKRRW